MIDFATSDWLEPIANLRSLARQGVLAEVARDATGGERVRLTGAAFALAWPIVFNRLTRTNEQRRGHHSCAVSVSGLADGCLDRFYDDVEAVVDDLLTHATVSIANPEGWITSRLRAATVDAHRRRRGARGALQRPRLPGWLVQQLPAGPWHQRLAAEILVWVGVPATAGTQLWPLDSWTELRATVTGDQRGSDTRVVQRDVEAVLAAMRLRPGWYADYVERPLGRKTPPLAPSFAAGNTTTEPPPLIVTGADEILDTRLAELASLALAAIEQELAAGSCDDAAVGQVLTTVFGRIDTAADLAQAPQPVGGRSIESLVGDPAQLQRIGQVIREILRPGDAAA